LRGYGQIHFQKSIANLTPIIPIIPIIWNLQLSYDLKIAEAELKDRIEREVEEMAA